ncbi:conserved hypothetical protein [Neospora caninum Liverpool]|uniref:Uncharacterized protein n=1 Tax=Neospora caninum (strain Liverpool) TaxID=572307 RepID=F0VQS0_NEOCL|nr:conserved hypothetical protein [Neospora caninum Liverpool]CBZ56067.1 conserved hypothetical protein [Neospora caninum Liverpool]CEL70815.1 TPA: hypothetical protein BN1204_064930 [Neospora caninum Liverpool]|eukprot:XP_003886093.1 conserved hypothetical protein [Neospora caninum Liverpool]
MSCYRHVFRSAPAVALAEVQRWGRRNNVHKLTLLVQTYEKPCVKRTRIAEEKAYYPRWFYLRYATEVIRYSLKHHLRLGQGFDPNDDQRLDGLKPLRVPSTEERRQELAKMEGELASVQKQIVEMDVVSVITGARKSLASHPLHVSAADILAELEASQGRLLSLSAFLRRFYRPGNASSQSWSLSELRILHLRLARFVKLVLDIHATRELLALQDGRHARWGKSLSEEELGKLFDTKRVDLPS